MLWMLTPTIVRSPPLSISVPEPMWCLGQELWAWPRSMSLSGILLESKPCRFAVDETPPYDSLLSGSWWIVSMGNGECRGLVASQMMYVGHENMSDVVSSWHFAKLRIKERHSVFVLNFWIVTGEKMLCGFKIYSMRTGCAPFGDESASWACW